jgi:hypothetical protein
MKCKNGQIVTVGELYEKLTNKYGNKEEEEKTRKKKIHLLALS